MDIQTAFESLPQGYVLSIHKIAPAHATKDYTVGDGYVSVVNPDNTNESGLDCKPDEIEHCARTLIDLAIGWERSQENITNSKSEEA